MASLIVAAGVFTYDRVQKTRTKRKERKQENAARFSELEKDNAQRMARLQSQCGQSQQYQGQDFNGAASRERGESTASEKSRRSSLAEEGPPPPGYEEAMRDRMGRERSSS